MHKLYLRKAGKTTPVPSVNGVRHRTWGVRVDGVLVGYVEAGKYPVTTIDHVSGFRGFTTTGTPVTPHGTDRTIVRNLTAARRDWA